MINSRRVGHEIAKMRSANEISQDELALMLGVSPNQIIEWERGEALPNIEQAYLLAHALGTSVEDLMNAAYKNLENEDSQANPNIGTFFDAFIADIGNMFRTEGLRTRQGEQNQEAATAEQNQRTITGHAMNIQQLLQMAPYMTREAVEEFAEQIGDGISLQQIEKLAPYIDTPYLEKLLKENLESLSWETLQRVAPYMKNETVDTLARLLLKNQQNSETVQTDVPATVVPEDNVIDKQDNNVVSFRESNTDALQQASLVMEKDVDLIERIENYKYAAFEKALEQSRWDWIEEHIKEIHDASLLQKVALRAKAEGRSDWVSFALTGYVDDAVVDQAIRDGDWGWLSEKISEFDATRQQKIATEAAKAENWQWLSINAEKMEMGDTVIQITNTARKAGARLLAIQLVRYDMDPRQTEAVLSEALREGDSEWIDMVLDYVDETVLGKCCIHYMQRGGWDGIERYVERMRTIHLEWLLNTAIQVGNFDAIDQLTQILSERSHTNDRKA